MGSSQRALLDELKALPIGDPDAEVTFAQRLARENGWSQEYAGRVIGEYKRFLFLAATCQHVVCPSEQVDQAWHMHLTYTRSYWDDLCRRVLGRPLHHSPTKGGRAELTKFIDLYNQTLDSYVAAFGQAPPADIWPPPRQRFGEDSKHVTINPSRYWIIPKPRWPRLPIAFTRRKQLLLAGGLAFPFAASWNLLEWKGPDFLGAYVMIATGTALTALALRTLLARMSGGTGLTSDSPLGAYEVACLAAGPQRVVEAAFVSMAQAGTLQVAEAESKFIGFFPTTTRTISQGTKLPSDAPEIERALYDAAFSPVTSWKNLLLAGLPAARNIQSTLIERGLIHSTLRTLAFLIPVMIMAFPLGLAIPKLALGISRGKPVGYLILATIATAVASFLFLASIPRVTRLGAAVVGRLRRHRAGTVEQVKDNCRVLPPADLAFSIGLFGAGLLACGPLSHIHAMLPRTREPITPTGENNSISWFSGFFDNNNGCSANGCSSSAGGCGGGGCGGGGCGGCGS